MRFLGLNHSAFGLTMVLLSSLFFYLATVPVFLGTQAGLSFTDYTSARFWSGLIVFGPLLVSGWDVLRKHSPWSLVLRGLTNFMAVWCFFKTVELGDPALGNTLNLTYPVFGVAIAAVLGDEDRLVVKALFALLAVVGIFFVVGPNLSAGSMEAYVYGLSSGILAAFSIKSLQFSRETFPTSLVLAVMFVVGWLCQLLMVGAPRIDYTVAQWTSLSLSAFSGLLGQLTLTIGARYCSATEVGIISTSRLLMALLAAALFDLRATMDFLGMLGGLLIFIANVGIALNRRVPQKRTMEECAGEPA